MVDTKKRESKTKTKAIYNLSSVILWPILGRPYYWYDKYLLNFYMGDRNFPEYDNHLFAHLLTVIDDNNDKLSSILSYMRNHNNLVHEYEPSSDTKMFVFNIPDEYKKDYELFKKGKYSLLSDRLKNALLGRDTFGPTFEVLTRSPDLKAKREEFLDVRIADEAELLDPPFPEREIFNF